ncbi:hypothetical protein ACFL2O_10815 [Thermodesulfobacteriota bacterium]
MSCEKIKLLLCTIILLSLYSCSTKPVYQTTYDFIPPASAEGKACTHQCETINVQCKQIADMQADSKREEVRRQYLECERQRRSEKYSTRICFEYSVYPDYSRCSADYRRCFQRCGGKVITETKCIKNCEKNNVTHDKGGVRK